MTLQARILVVDDEASIRRFLKDLFTGEGYRVVVVDSGEAALAEIAKETFDLALVDLQMPGIGGIEVVKALAKRSPDTAIIVLTAHGSLETSIEALRHGAHDYLLKPTEAGDLRESVRVALRKRQQEQRRNQLLAQLEQSLLQNLEEIRATTGDRPESSLSALDSPDVLRWKRLVVDLARHVITLDGHPLELTPTEFDLLTHLVREAPRVLSPQELVSAAQGYESEPWEAREIVRHHIYNIRQKFRDAADHTGIIRTVRGVGYTLASK